MRKPRFKPGDKVRLVKNYMDVPPEVEGTSAANYWVKGTDTAPRLAPLSPHEVYTVVEAEGLPDGRISNFILEERDYYFNAAQFELATDLDDQQALTRQSIRQVLYDLRRNHIDNLADRRVRQDLDALATVMMNYLDLKGKNS